MKNKNIHKYILAFLIPFIILTLFCISRKIGIFGENSLLVSDFQAQYIVLLKHLREGNSIIYSLSKGLGGGMLSTFAYYLSSPLNILIYLFPKDQIVLASIFLIVLRISLSGLTMFTYLSSHFKEKKYTHLMFSTCYALMAYVVNYHFHIMWLDGIMLLPLVMLGIDKLFEKKSTLYIVSLFLAVLSNYYIGYMICIMSILYFISNLILKYSWKKEKKEIKGVVIRFIISSLLGGLLTMCLQLPNLLELQNGYKMNSDGLEFSGLNLSFLDLWSRTYIFSHNYENILANDVISIYCGLIILPLLYFYFVNKKIKTKEKIVYGILLLILLSGYFINAVGMVYHAFNITNCYNYRFSFLICFIMIMISCKSFKYIKEINKHHYLIFLIFYSIMSIVMLFCDYTYLSINNIWISCIVMILYLVLLYLFNRYNKNNDLKILLFAIVIAETLFNLFMTLEKFEYYQTDEFNYYAYELGPQIEKYQIENPEYRISSKILATYNDSMYMNYHGISAFLSTVDVMNLKFLKNSGFYYTGMSAMDFGNNTMVMDSLLGVKYRISSVIKENYINVQKVEYPTFNGLLYHPTVMSKAIIYENPYALQIGYTISSSTQKEKIKLDDVFEFQNYLLNSMLDNDKVYFKSYESNKLSEGAYEFIINGEENIYVYFDYYAQIGNCNTLINGVKYDSASEVFAYKNTDGKEKIRVSLDGEVIKYGGAVAYSFDEEEFMKDIKALQNDNVKFETVEDGHLKGTVKATEEFNRLFFSIPYEDGWSLYIDGEEVEIDLAYDAFMQADLEVGEHNFELKYEAPGLKAGIAVSSVTLILTGIYLYFEKKSSKKVK